MGDGTLLVAVSGPKNSGKTHLLELLIDELVTANRSFAVVKHDAHAHMKVDHPGKDSWRFRQAGAARLAVIGPLGTVRLDYSVPFTDRDEIDRLVSLFPEAELVLAEGFKDHLLPRIKLIGERDRPAERMLLSALPVTDSGLLSESPLPISVGVCLAFIDGLARQIAGPAHARLPDIG